MGLSLSATVVQAALRSHLKVHLGSEGDTERIADGARASLKCIEHLEPAVQAVVRRCYGTATRAGFVLVLRLAGLAIVSSSKSDILGCARAGRSLIWRCRFCAGEEAGAVSLVGYGEARDCFVASLSCVSQKCIAGYSELAWTDPVAGFFCRSNSNPLVILSADVQF